ncbi:MAG: YceI family protein [Gemmatimonadales bacterium]
MPAAAASPAGAQSAWPDRDVRAGRLSFDAKATLGDFTGVTDSVRGQMVGAASLTEVRGWVEAPVRTLETGNGLRDKDLRKSMEADIYPTIRFQLEGVEPGEPRGDSTAVTLVGRFYIHGVSRAERIPATVYRAADRIRVTATLPLNVKDYQIGGLTRFLLFKMNPNIVVHIDVTF